MRNLINNFRGRKIELKYIETSISFDSETGRSTHKCRFSVKRGLPELVTYLKAQYDYAFGEAYRRNVHTVFPEITMDFTEVCSIFPELDEIEITESTIDPYFSQYVAETLRERMAF